jgi:hypothetical protein
LTGASSLVAAKKDRRVKPGEGEMGTVMFGMEALTRAMMHRAA